MDPYALELIRGEDERRAQESSLLTPPPQILPQVVPQPAVAPRQPAALEAAVQQTQVPTAPVRPQPIRNAPTWKQVTEMPEMRGLPSAQLEDARHQYFVDVVAPHVETDDLDAARAAFDADTKPSILRSAIDKLGETLRTIGEGEPALSMSTETLDQLERSYRSLKQSVFATDLTASGRALRELDRVDRGEKLETPGARYGVGPSNDPFTALALEYQRATPERRAATRQRLQESYGDDLRTIAKEAAEISGLYHNPNAQEAIEAANNQQWRKAWDAFAADPVGIVKDLSLSNSAQAVPMVGLGVAGAAAKGVPGLMVGFASGSFPVDYAMSLVEYLNDQGVDLKDYRAVDAMLRQPGFLEELQNYAALHATGVAALDTATGRIMSPVRGGVVRATAAAAGNVGKAVVGEMAGEAAGELLAEGRIKPGEVIAEGLAAGPMAVGGSAAATLARAPAAGAEGQPQARSSEGAQGLPGQALELPATTEELLGEIPVRAVAAPESQMGVKRDAEPDDRIGTINRMLGDIASKIEEGGNVEHYQARAAELVAERAQLERAQNPDVDADALSRQNRDRSRAASVTQMQEIANAPDYDRMATAPIPDVGAPMVSVKGDTALPAGDVGKASVVTLGDGTKIPVHYAVVDAPAVLASHDADGKRNAEYFGEIPQGRIVAMTNGRVAGLQAAYGRDTAKPYVEKLLADPEHGVSAEAIRAKQRPMLVRVFDDAYNKLPRLAELSNTGGSAPLSTVEKARGDAARITSLEGFAPSESGDVGATSNMPFVRQFMQAIPKGERGELMAASGELSQEGARRLRAAVFAKAYGGGDALQRMVESTDDNVRSVIAGLMRAAPAVARLREKVAAGALQDLDITADVLRAVEELSRLREQGISVGTWLAQADMFGALSPELVGLLEFLEENARSGRRIADFLERYLAAAEAIGAPGGMFETETPSKAAIVRGIRKEMADERQTGLPQGAQPAAADAGPAAGGVAGTGAQPSARAPQPVQKVEEREGGKSPEGGVGVEPKQEFASTQVPLPAQLSARVKAAAKELIAPEDIEQENGLEDRPHITVKFGLHTPDVAAVQKIVGGQGAVQAKVTGIEIFSPEGKDYDVVVQRVSSLDLTRLNKTIADAIPHTDTHPVYRPHITLGYVKRGRGKKYADAKTGLEGQSITLDTIEVSDQNENLTPIKLGGSGLTVGSGLIAKAQTGQPFKARLLRGQGREGSPYNPMGAQEPILGEGRYTTSDREFAAHFGPAVTEHEVALDNPLVISSDPQWRALVKRAGWEFPNPFGQKPEKVKSDIAKLRAIVETEGHDGVIVRVPESELEGKTLQRVFEADQVVEFKQQRPGAAGLTVAKHNGKWWVSDTAGDLAEFDAEPQARRFAANMEKRTPTVAIMQQAIDKVGEQRFQELVAERMERAAQRKLPQDEQVIVEATARDIVGDVDPLKAELDDALADLGGWVEANILPKAAMLPDNAEENLLPILSRLFTVAIKMGYRDFAAASKFVMKEIRKKAAQLADLINDALMQRAFKEAQDAGSVRGDQESVGERGRAAEGGEVARRENLQRQPQARPAAGDQVQPRRDGGEGNQVGGKKTGLLRGDRLIVDGNKATVVSTDETADTATVRIAEGGVRQVKSTGVLLDFSESFPADVDAADAKARRIEATHLIQSPERIALRKTVAKQTAARGARLKDGRNVTIRSEKQFYYLMGLPASGKSAVANRVQNEQGARIIDADIAKELFPEFDNGLGASALHVESSDIAEQLLHKSFARGENIIYPGVGKGENTVHRLIAAARKNGYKVHLYFVDLPIEKAMDRVVKRFRQTGRFVPPSYLRDVGDQPRQVFEVVKQESIIESWSDYSNDVPFGSKPRLLARGPEGARRDDREGLRYEDAGAVQDRRDGGVRPGQGRGTVQLQEPEDAESGRGQRTVQEADGEGIADERPQPPLRPEGPKASQPEAVFRATAGADYATAPGDAGGRGAGEARSGDSGNRDQKPEPQRGTRQPASQVAEAGDSQVAARAGQEVPSKAAGEITDVGENLWYNRRNFTGKGIAWSDVKGLNDTLKLKEVTKSRVWPRPDYEQLVADGMQPFFARALKQVYDGISTAPVMRGAASDVDLQRYMDVVHRVRDAVFEWAKDQNSNKEFLDNVVGSLPQKTGGQVRISELAKPADFAAVLLKRVWPAEMEKSRYERFHGEAGADVAVIGGNRALKALQFTRDDLAAVLKDIERGWPKSQEAWQRQGYRVVPTTDTVILEGGDAKQKTVFRVFTKSGWGGRQISEHATRAEAEAAKAAMKPWMLLDKRNHFVGEFETEDAAKEAARGATQRKGAGGDVRGMNIAESEREGPARRGTDEDVPSQRLMDTFGFRGVNFGREGWINQAERQAYLNHAYDALLDLAEVIKVPPKALSLNGMLGLAFGAQGRGGGTAAHFIPGVNEINLTKTKGAGTLAHEWGHALDHHFGVLAGLAKAEYPFLSEANIKKAEGIRPEIREAFQMIVETMKRRMMVPDEVRAQRENSRARAERNLNGWIKSIRSRIESSQATATERALREFDQLADRLRVGDLGEGYVQSGKKSFPQVVAMVRNLYKDVTGRLLDLDATTGLTWADSVKMNRNENEAQREHIPQTSTTYGTESAKADKGKGGKRYWATEREMFARAFETYVADKLAEASQKNTFLSDAAIRAEMKTPEGAYAMPYPRGDDRKRINAAIAKLIGQLETKETERGVTVLSRETERRGLAGMAPAGVRRVAETFRTGFPGLPKLHVLDKVSEAPDSLTAEIKRLGGEADTAGAWHNGEVYLFAENINSPMHAEWVILHESTHHGLRGMLGSNSKPLFMEIYMKNAEVRKLANEQRKRNPNLSIVAAVEEVLANMGADGVPQSVMAQIIAWVRKVLRKLGVKLQLSDGDIQTLVADALRFVKEKPEKTHLLSGTALGPALSRTAGQPAIPTRPIAETRGLKAHYVKVANKVIDFTDRLSNPLVDLPGQEEFLGHRQLVMGVIDRANDIVKTVRKVFEGATEADRRATVDYFTTAGATTARISEGRREGVEKIKKLINSMSDYLVETGVISAESREEFRDRYLPQLYLRWLLDDKHWEMGGGGKRASEMGYTKQRKLTQFRGPDGEIKLKEKGTGRVLSDEEVLSLGPVTDPAFLAAVAIAGPMRDMAILDWLKIIAKGGLTDAQVRRYATLDAQHTQQYPRPLSASERAEHAALEKKYHQWVLPSTTVEWNSKSVSPYFLKAEADRLRQQAEHYQGADARKTRDYADRMDAVANKAIEGMPEDRENYLQIPTTARYGAMRGIWVRKEIYHDLMGAHTETPDNWFKNWFGEGGKGEIATRWWKAGKTILNLPGQFRNVGSNLSQLQLDGIGFHKQPLVLARVAKEIRTNGQYYKEFKQQGGRGGTFANQELGRMEDELLKLQKQGGKLSALGKVTWLARIIYNAAGDAWQGVEVLGKMMAFVDARENGATAAQAMRRANRALFDYSLVQPWIRYARRVPFGIAFATWTAKVLPRLVDTALLHPQRYLPYVIFYYGAQYALAAMLGVDDDDLEKLKKALPEWLRNKRHAMLLPFKDEHGRWQAVDLGYFMPWTNWLQLGTDAVGAAKGEPGKLGNLLRDIGAFSGPIPNIATAISTGKDPFTHRDIANDGDPADRQAASWLNYAWSMAMPPVLTDIGALGHGIRAYSGQTDKYGSPLDTPTQAGLRLFGVNLYALEPEKTRAANLRRMEFEAKETIQATKLRLADRSVQGEARSALIKEYQDETKRRAGKIQQYIKESQIHPNLRTER